jgi:hypothetical protein
MKPLSAADVFLRPLSGQAVPDVKQTAVLFPANDAGYLWYTGFVKHWSEFQKEAADFWTSQPNQHAFSLLKTRPVGPPADMDTEYLEADGQEILEGFVVRELLDVTRELTNRLGYRTKIDMLGFQGDVVFELKDEELVVEDRAPYFALKMAGAPFGGASLVGYVEYLGGRTSALTWAIDEAKKTTWGSLRCVLGKCHTSRLPMLCLPLAPATSDPCLF